MIAVIAACAVIVLLVALGMIARQAREIGRLHAVAAALYAARMPNPATRWAGGDNDAAQLRRLLDDDVAGHA